MRRHSYFSLEEANALLPTLEHFFRELALVRRELLDVREALARHGATVHPEGIALPRMAKKSGKTLVARYQRLCEDYDVLMEELVGLGVELVDIDAGVVNFYSWWDGEEVLLNWQYGEPAVQFWMDPGETSAVRRPLGQLFYDLPQHEIQRH